MPTDPIDDIVILPSVIGFHVVPPSVDFHAPPPVAPNQYSFGRASLPSAAIDRPPRAGPTLRQRIPLYRLGSTVDACRADTGNIQVSTTPTINKRVNLIAGHSTLTRTLATESRRTRRLVFSVPVETEGYRK